MTPCNKKFFRDRKDKGIIIINEINMKYKLLKDFPGCKEGEIFTLIENSGNYSNERGLLLEYMQVEDNKEWFEEIKEVKSIYNTVIGDLFYIYGYRVLSYTELNGIEKPYYGDIIGESIKLGDAFLTRKEAETELSKRKAMQTIKKYFYDTGDIVVRQKLDKIEKLEKDLINHIKSL